MEGVFLVCLLTLTGKVIGIRTFSQNRMSDIKARMQHSEGITPTQQRLIFAGANFMVILYHNPSEDPTTCAIGDRTLEEYKFALWVTL
jgi:hypothetical protein